MATITDFNDLLLYQATPPAVPYLFGGIWLKGDPTHAPGFDCSGGPYAVAAKLGQPIPRTSEAQFANLPRIPAPQRRGDAIFYDVASDNQAQPAHVAIYWSPGYVWQAPHTGEDCGIYPDSALPYPIMGYCSLPFPDAPPPVPPPINQLEEMTEMGVAVAQNGDIVSTWVGAQGTAAANHAFVMTQKAGTQGQPPTSQNTSIIDVTATWSFFAVQEA